MMEIGDIIATLLDRLASHPAHPLVTEDWSKRVSDELYPLIIVMERPDNVLKVTGGPTPIYRRAAFISIICFIEGTDGEQAPGEMRAFLQDVRRCIYQGADQTPKLGQYGAGIYEHAMSGVFHPPSGKNAIARELVFRVPYNEVTARLFS